jgi:hypothetical protein
MCNCKKCKKKEKKISKISNVRQTSQTSQNLQNLQNPQNPRNLQNQQNNLSYITFENQVQRAYNAGLPVPYYAVDPYSNVFQEYVLHLYINPRINSGGSINAY